MKPARPVPNRLVAPLLPLAALVGLVGSGADAHGAPNHLKLSPKVSLQWKDGIRATSAFTPGFSAYVLAGSYRDKPFTGMTRIEASRAPASTAGAAKAWRESFGAATKRGDRVIGQSCRKLGKDVFRCDRKVRAKTGQYVSDFMLWHEGRKSVYVRINSDESLKHSAEVLKRFEVVLR